MEASSPAGERTDMQVIKKIYPNKAQRWCAPDEYNYWHHPSEPAYVNACGEGSFYFFNRRALSEKQFRHNKSWRRRILLAQLSGSSPDEFILMGGYRPGW
jgi:hypothetical protein